MQSSAAVTGGAVGTGLYSAICRDQRVVDKSVGLSATPVIGSLCYHACTALLAVARYQTLVLHHFGRAHNGNNLSCLANYRIHTGVAY